MGEQVESSYGLRCWSGTPPLMGIAHRHDDVEINYVAHGTMTYSFGGRRLTLQSGDVVVFWAAMPHQLVASERAVLTWLTLPLAQFLGWRLPPAITAPVLNGIPVLQPRRRSIDARAMLERWHDDLAVASVEDQRIVFLELEAWLRRLARAEQPSKPDPHPQRTTSVAAADNADRMAQFIAAHFHEPLRIQSIAAAVALHPNYAMRVFRQTFGVSLLTYLTQHRIAHAQRLLVTTDLPIGEIAFETGFASLSRFYRAFNACCGETPRGYRQARRIGFYNATDATANSADDPPDAAPAPQA